MSTATISTRLLAFSLLATLFSGFGQTFFIGLFGGAWRTEFDLDYAELGMLYSAATLTSGLLIVTVGRWLDHIPLHRYTAGVVMAFAVGCVVIALAPSALWLIPGILLLRLCGQGLMGHIAITTIARYFSARRGRALAIAQLGYPIGEALLPLLVVVALSLTDWRHLWWLAALALLMLLPVLLRLSVNLPAPTEDTNSTSHASRRQVLRDWRFYAILPVTLTAPFIITGLFFHQVAVAEATRWSLTLLASAFSVYAILQVSGGLLTGFLIDRYSARRLMRFYLLPMGLGCLVLWWGESNWLVFAYMGLLGLSAGANGTLGGALWAELYGTRYIGAIRAMMHALMVVSTAISPVLFGLLMDGGMSIRSLALVLAVYALVIPLVLGGSVLREAR
ncbi:MFS transporter [Kineobactrum sediminis]|uniref:MFS transporter n=1 Tax=Kineobactrum sediminis TaxID=1905677 RepID=UPI0013901C25|nr:MFS transporter [Kineobactrum sediminis]